MNINYFPYTIYTTIIRVTELHLLQCDRRETLLHKPKSLPGFEDSVLLAFWPTPGDLLDDITEKRYK